MQETASVSDFYFIFLELASSGGRAKTHQTLSANFLAIYINTLMPLEKNKALLRMSLFYLDCWVSFIFSSF